MSATISLFLILLSIASLVEIDCYVVDSSNQHNSWVLSHVLFRHGNRTPEVTELYPKDPYLHYKYYPFGNGQLTNVGKEREYSIGTALHQRYSRILGNYFFPAIVDARSTDYDRTKMSLELVLASLFPPRKEESWQKNGKWLPAPFNFSSRDHDRILLGINCPTYKKLYNQQLNSPKWQHEFSWYRTFFNYISENTGLNVTTFEDVYDLYFGLKTESEWGFALPPWTYGLMDDITAIATKQYSVYTATTELRRMAAGYLLQKIIQDTRNAISGNNGDTRIYLYSAHENTLAQLLITLDIFGKPHVPNYGAYVNIEVHRTGTNRHGIKIYYQNYVTSEPQLLKLPACSEICDLDKFEELTREYIPSVELCGD